MVDEKNTSLKAWLYLAPTLILMAIFTFYPLISTIRLAFVEGFDYTVSGNVTSLGFQNFVAFFNYRNNGIDALTVIKNTFVVVFVTVPLSTLLALLIALALNSIKALQKFFQTIFFLPYVTNVIAIGMAFAVMFNTDYGLINLVLSWFGIDAVNWIGIGAGWGTSMFVLVVYIVWNALPFKILILLSGMQNISKQYYDAAKIDSTPKWRVFTKITVPLLSPMIAYVLVTSFIGAFKEYSSVVAIFGANMGPVGQAHSMDTIVGFTYALLGKQGSIGIAAAAAVFLFVIIMIFTAINFIVSAKRIHY